MGGRYRSLQVFPGKVAADRLQEFMQGLGFRASRLRQMDSFLHSPRRTSELFSFSRSRSLSLSLLVYNIYLYIYVCILATIFFLYLCVVLSILCMHTHTHARAVLSLLSQLASTCGQTRVFPTAARICIFQGYTQSVSDGARSMQEPVLQARLFGVVL